MLSIWQKERKKFIEDIFRKIANDFRRELTAEEISIAAVLFVNAEVGLLKEFFNGNITADRFCYHYAYLMGLLSRLDEVSIQKNISRAFEFANSHTSLDIFKFG